MLLYSPAVAEIKIYSNFYKNIYLYHLLSFSLILHFALQSADLHLVSQFRHHGPLIAISEQLQSGTTNTWLLWQVLLSLSDYMLILLHQFTR